MPFIPFTPPGVLGIKMNTGDRVPMDDYHTMNFFMSVNRGKPGTGVTGPVVFPTYKPNTSDWYGRFRFETDTSNDFQIDRALQRTGKGGGGFTGIAALLMQDAAMTTSRGPIFDRTKEHLGSTDAMVIQARRRLLNTGKAPKGRGPVRGARRRRRA